jgi:hypothetical protein
VRFNERGSDGLMNGNVPGGRAKWNDARRKVLSKGLKAARSPLCTVRWQHLAEIGNAVDPGAHAVLILDNTRSPRSAFACVPPTPVCRRRRSPYRARW